MRPARCLEPGESLRRAPILPKAGWASRTPLTVTATPIKGQGEEPAGCLVMLRQHEELLAHPVVQLQIATLASILENFPIPFFMVDPDLVVTHMNERLERLTGYSSKEVVGRMTCGQVLNTRAVRHLRLRPQAGHGTPRSPFPDCGGCCGTGTAGRSR